MRTRKEKCWRCKGTREFMGDPCTCLTPRPSPQPTRGEAPAANRFDCVGCGIGVKADEDGCCAHCGHDCVIVRGGVPDYRALAAERADHEEDPSSPSGADDVEALVDALCRAVIDYEHFRRDEYNTARTALLSAIRDREQRARREGIEEAARHVEACCPGTDYEPGEGIEVYHARAIRALPEREEGTTHDPSMHKGIDR